ncbi:hypothetical protein [Dickeya poaceiphila]|uniref:Uncharacterized protein n=1 Tax=Dickeya poaceiphila TaxID=568768 RepID=A0A5B8HPC1_9GAMM|nr:hypothetical protein [Dickeya poaceiphila]QDX30985.1 hypothetical protein Dpoa569_0002941 [Dickeya poaceiphila]
MARGVNKITLISFLAIVSTLNGFLSLPVVFCLLMLIVTIGNINTRKDVVDSTENSTTTSLAQNESLQDKQYPADSF